MSDATDATSLLTPDSTVADVARAYLAQQSERNEGNRPQYLDDEQKLIKLFIYGTEFGKLRLRRVSTGVVTAEYRRIKVTLDKPGRARHWLTLMRKMLDLAAEFDLVRENAARGYKPAREKSIVGYTPEADDVWQLRQAVKAYAARPNRRGPKPTPLLMDTLDVVAGTGLRIGEALGLRWRDVELDSVKPRLLVVGTVVEGHGQKKRWQPEPKTKYSERTIAIPSFLVTTLRRRQREARLGGHTYVFQTRTGEPVGPHQVRVQLWKVRKWVLEQPAMKNIDAAMALHALRRMVATEVTVDFDIVVAAQLAGHAKAAVTEKAYVKHRPEGPDVRTTTQRLGRPYGEEGED